MRIWDISPKRLCRNHLLGEHRELHAIWSVLVNGKKGYAHHPETLRWRGKLRALYGRHDALVQEMAVRGYQHRSPVAEELGTRQRYPACLCRHEARAGRDFEKEALSL